MVDVFLGHSVFLLLTLAASQKHTINNDVRLTEKSTKTDKPVH